MTRDEILALPAGRELDATVAEKVMGLHPVQEPVPYGYGPEHTEIVWRDAQGYKAGSIEFSTDIAAAWEVAEKFRMTVSCPDAFLADGEYRNGDLYKAEADAGFRKTIPSVCATADTAPLAICLAALIAATQATPAASTDSTAPPG